jgi:hypothetical protein
MKESLYRVAVLALLSALLYFQIQQRKDIQALGYVDRSPARTQDVRVVKWDADPLPITTPMAHIGNEFSQISIPVVVKNTGFGDAVPVQVHQ